MWAQQQGQALTHASPSDILLLGTLDVTRIQSPHLATRTGEEVFRHTRLWRTFHIQAVRFCSDVHR